MTATLFTRPAAWLRRIAASLSAMAVGVFLCGSLAASPPVTPPSVFDGTYRAGDVLWIGHDGSSVSAFTHTPFSPGGEHQNLGPLLAGHDWNNVRAVDVNARGQIVLADIDGPVIYTTNLDNGQMRVLSGLSWVDNDPQVGDGPMIGSMTDIEFGPDGFVYLMTSSQSVAGPWSPTVMRIDPIDGARSIVATIDTPEGNAARFAFAPDGGLFVAIGAVPSVGSSVFAVDVGSGDARPLGTPGENYGFSINDIAIGADGDAYLLVGGHEARRLDLTTGATEHVLARPADFFASEMEVAPDGSLVMLRYGYISAVESVASDGSSSSDGGSSSAGGYGERALAGSLPFNRPYTMTLVPVPEPSSVLLCFSAVVLLGMRLRRRCWVR